LQLEEERLEAIHRENQKLLDKMARIMSTKGDSYTYNDYECRRHASYMYCMLYTIYGRPV